MDLLTDLLLIESKADRYESMMKARSPPASLQFIGQVTEHTTVKWSIETNLTRYQVLVTRCLADPTSKKIYARELIMTSAGDLKLKFEFHKTFCRS